MAEARRFVVNPSNLSQAYRLWSNGQIDALGGAPTPSGNPTWFNATIAPARAIQIINWTTPTGYVLDYYGQVHAFGGATAPSSQAPSSDPYDYYKDFVMNPAGNGQGIVMHQAGGSVAIGGASAITQFSLGASARRIVRDWASGKGYVLDGFGGRHPFGGAPVSNGSPSWPGFDIARGIVILDYTTGAGYIVTGWGSVHEFKGAEAAPGFQYYQGRDIVRDFAVISLDPLTIRTMTNNGNMHPYTVSNPPTLTAGGAALLPANPTTDSTRPILAFDFDDTDGDSMSSAEVIVYKSADVSAFVDEVNTLSTSGSPTGGTFKLRMEGYITGAIARNASAATIQTALRLLPTLGSIICAGGPLGTAAVTITHAGARDGCYQRRIVPTAIALTGGTNPNVTCVKTTDGTEVFPDIRIKGPEVFHAVIVDPTQRATQFVEDLPNGTYFMYVKGADSSGDESGTTVYSWVQNVTRPTAPVLTATDRGGIDGIALGITVASPPAGSLLHVEYSDDYDPSNPTVATWQTLRNADDLETFTSGSTWGIREPGMGIRQPGVGIRGGGSASSGSAATDAEAFFGVRRYYRAWVYTPSPYLASLPSAVVSATLTGNAWILSDPEDSDTQIEVAVVPPFDFSRRVVSSTMYPVGRGNAVVVRDGGIKGAESNIRLRTLNVSDYDRLVSLLETPSPLLLRDVFGRGWYFDVVEGVDFRLMRAQPVVGLDDPAWPIRHANDIIVGATQVDRPPVTEPDPFATFFA